MKKLAFAAVAAILILVACEPTDDPATNVERLEAAKDQIALNTEQGDANATALIDLVIEGIAPTTTTTQPTTTTTTTTQPTTTTTTQPPSESEWMLGDLPDGPTSGSAWSFLVGQANTTLSPDLDDQNDMDAAHAYAAGLVYARTGNTTYQNKVHAALDQLPSTPWGDRNDVLSVGRQLAGYVLAADLTDYQPTTSWRNWLANLPSQDIGTHSRWQSLNETSEVTSSNWGAFALSSRAAVAAYLGDTDEIDRVAEVFKGWVGDASSHDAWVPTADFDQSWACDYPNWDPVNAADCGDLSGALVEDISRGESYPNATSTGWNYTGESLQGAMLTALILEHNGYPGVWGWEDSAMRRTFEFIERFNGDPHSVNDWIFPAADAKYGTSYTETSAGHGRHFGFTDWYTP